jgi:hypothetical protein
MSQSKKILLQLQESKIVDEKGFIIEYVIFMRMLYPFCPEFVSKVQIESFNHLAISNITNFENIN